MKYALSVLLCLGIVANGFSQTHLSEKEQRANLEKQANLLSQYLLKKDYKAFAEFTYPAVANMMGGKEKMSVYLEQAMSGMKEQGFTFSNVTIGTPATPVTHATQLQCTIPQTIELSYAAGKLLQRSTLIGISMDGGANWTFIDTHGERLQKLQETIPELSNQLVIPEKEAPQLVEN